MDIKNSLLPFVIAFIACAVAFVALDALVMNMQGLTLIFEQ